MDAGSQDAGRFWSSFGRDPRVRDNQGLRAGDRDRDIVRDAISEAYADGRLTSTELDARLTQVQEATLLGDLLPIVADLMPTRETASRQSLVACEPGRDRPPGRRALSGAPPPGPRGHARAVVGLSDHLDLEHDQQRRALIFPWPLFVIIGTGGYLSRLVFGRESAIEEEREKLRKKQAEVARHPAGCGRPSVRRRPRRCHRPERSPDHWR